MEIQLFSRNLCNKKILEFELNAEKKQNNGIKASVKCIHQSQKKSLYSAGNTYKVKWHADFLFNKFPQKISFSQWEEFQGLP